MKSIVKEIIYSILFCLLVLIVLVYYSLVCNKGCLDDFFAKNEMSVYLTVIRYIMLILVLFVAFVISIITRRKVARLRKIKQWKISLLILIIFIPAFVNNVSKFMEKTNFIDVDEQLLCQKLSKSNNTIKGVSLSYNDYEMIRKYITFKKIPKNSLNIQFEYKEKDTQNTDFKLSYVISELDGQNINSFKKEEELYVISQEVISKNDSLFILYEKKTIGLGELILD